MKQHANLKVLDGTFTPIFVHMSVSQKIARQLRKSSLEDMSGLHMNLKITGRLTTVLSLAASPFGPNPSAETISRGVTLAIFLRIRLTP